MNKKLLWSALVLAPQLAFAQGAAPAGAAQAGVSVYGVVDMALSSYRGEGAGSRSMLTSSGNQASRLGFKGRESLGDSLWAGFELESGLNTDTGTGQASNTNNQPSGAVNANGGITFNRKAYVYLEGKDWGQLRLGRDYTPAFWNLFAFDPFRVGVGMSGHVLNGTTATGFRASNSVGYFSPGCTTFQCKGLFFQGMLAAGENSTSDATKRDGNLHAWRLGYGGAGFDVAVASATTKNAAVGDFVQTNIGGAYQWQGHRLMALVGQNKTRIPVAALAGPLLAAGRLDFLGHGLHPRELHGAAPQRRCRQRGAQAGRGLCTPAVQAHHAVRHLCACHQQGRVAPAREFGRRAGAGAGARRQCLGLRSGHTPRLLSLWTRAP